MSIPNFFKIYYNTPMPQDKFTATWVSNSSISDFLNCPRAYYLKNVWKRPETNHKVQLTTPPLSLGSAVHEVIEALSILPTNTRFTQTLIPKFEIVWEKYTGKLGGFFNVETEYKYKTRGQEMLRKLELNPGPLKNLAVKINMDLPHFWLDEENNIILCGKIDWLEYLPASPAGGEEKDGVNIIDFKTSKNDEHEDSLQLPIYYLLAASCQKRKVLSASYWYLENSLKPTQQALPDKDAALIKILKIAKEIKLARTLNKLSCPHNGCKHCEPLERIYKGGAEFVGVNSFGQDCFVLPLLQTENREGKIL